MNFFILLLAFLLGAVPCFGPKVVPTDDPAAPASPIAAESTASGGHILRSFRFTWGGYLPPQSYEITAGENGYSLTRDDGRSCTLNEASVDALIAIIDENGLDSWNGFQESDPYVLDGEGFSLSILWDDGTGIEAAGDNAFPENYFTVRADLMALLDRALDGDPTGTYLYEGNGFGGDFTLTLNADGSYTFYEGALSSYLGGGTWYQERELVYMNEENGFDLDFYFLFDDDALSYLKKYSDPFPYVDVPDGGRFKKTQAAP